MNKVQARVKRSLKTTSKIKSLGGNRLTVFRTPQHIYAQIIASDGRVLVSASTIEKSVRDHPTGNIDAASRVGLKIGERAIEFGISKVAFDRNGFKYHGRVKALAEKAREAGLIF